ncbi:MAG TPA: fumarylacetoacetate hydrolase family protein [Bryobacteraceae bacterium]|jgi:2-dehydro-3-deoxy-D-arabinonate dehydratase|nr:fumarylacetoacetate hydrolase family protein [Bryobacteraceae bacterium]
MKLYRTPQGAVVEDSGKFVKVEADWDSLVARGDLSAFLKASVERGSSLDPAAVSAPLAPIVSQEVWAAGVTYYRSRDARMEESKSAGGGDFYDRVYSAERPELFFKATPHRVVGPGQPVAIRSDAKWSVPEPELTLLLTPKGQIAGYTIGNDMSSRDIEGENPLYLPQAKVYNRSCALGPCILVSEEPLPAETEIRLEIRRANKIAYEGATTVASLKRQPKTLAEFLFRDNTFPNGCFLLTGTGIVPPDDFTLAHGDEIRITIPPVGTLVNPVG